MIKWHTRPKEELAADLGSDPVYGLSVKEAERRSAEKKNNLFGEKKEGLFYGKRVFLTFLPFLLLITALAALLSEETLSGYLLLGALAVFLSLVYFTYRKAGVKAEAVEEKSLPSVRVVREGKPCLVPCEDIAVGDLVLLSAGDLVPADCRLLTSEALVLREGGITGKETAHRSAEGLPVGGELTESPNMIFAGSYLVSGSCKALVCRVGAETHLATVFEKKEDAFEGTPVLRFLRRLSAILTAALLSLIFVFTLIGFIPAVPRDFLSAFVLACSLAAATASEFYGIFAYITAANSIYTSGIKEKGGLFRRLDALERAASVDRVFLTPSLFADSKERLYLADPFGKPVAAGESLSPALESLLRDGALALGDWYGKAPLGRGQSLDKPRLCEAVKVYRSASGLTDGEGERYPFLTYGRWEDGCFGAVLSGDDPVVTVLAPAERLLAYDGFVYRNGKTEALSEENRRLILKNRDTLLDGGALALRSVYAVGISVADSLPDVLDGDFVEGALSGGVIIEGFFLFERAVFSESLAALEKAREKGIAFTLLAEKEEQPLCQKLGFCEKQNALEKGRDSFVLGASRLEKLKLLRTSRSMGEVAAYLGEDASQLPHMKEADLSVAVGETFKEGVDAEREEGCRSYTDATRLSADLCIPCPREDGGGFAALWRGLSSANGYLYRVRAILRYLAVTFGVRLILTLFSLFTPTPLVSAETLALSGLIYDLGAIMTLSLCPLSHKGKSFRVRELVKPLAVSLGLGAASGLFISLYALFVPVSEALIPTYLLAVSMTYLVGQLIAAKVRPTGFGTAVLLASFLLFAFMLLLCSEDLLWPFAFVTLSFVEVLGSVRVKKEKKERKIPEKS